MEYYDDTYYEYEDKLVEEEFREDMQKAYPTLKSRLEFFMKLSGLNQYQLAKQSGISRSLINMIMNGRRDAISENTAKMICNAASKNARLLLNPDFLMGKSGTVLDTDNKKHIDPREDYEKQEDDILFLICSQILPLCGMSISENRVLGETLFRHYKDIVLNDRDTFEMVIGGYYRDTCVTDYQKLVNDIYDSIRFLVIRYAKKHQVRDFSIGRPIE